MSKKFKIDAKLILQLGRDSIKDHTTALLELVKNSYDADASKVEIEIYGKKGEDYVRVADNGFGMTEDEINDGWLRIGFSEKVVSKLSKKGRRKTGEKGIGRIAADRLGAKIQLITKSEADDVQALEINWDDFEVTGKDLSDIEIKELENRNIRIPQHGKNECLTGTEVLITRRRQPWTKSNIESLYDELSIFTPPFSSNSDFEIELKTDITESVPQKVESAYLKTAEIDIEAAYDGKSDEIIYTIKNKYYPKEEVIEEIKIPTMFSDDDDEREDKSKLKCGPFNLRLMFFPRISSLLSGTDFTLSDLRDFLDKNAGVKIYRDNISVKPYGYQGSQFGEDWLGLAERKGRDPAGVSRESYKVTPNQLVGAVFIGRDKNPDLKDSAAREGLVENDSFDDLKKAILGSVILLESHRVKLMQRVKKKKGKKGKSSKDNVESITEELTEVRDNLTKIRSQVVNLKDSSSLVRSIESVQKAIDQTEQTFEELLEEKRVLSGLATLGISSAVFGHETQNAITTFRDASSNARKSLFKANPNLDIAKSELDKAFKYAKLIAGWGSFALARVNNEKRKRVNKRLKQLIADTIAEIQPAFTASNITVTQDLDSMMAKVFAMDIESIILNLLTNSYNACMHGGATRAIRVHLVRENRGDIKGFKIIVADSGPGIAKEHRDNIWKPLFSTKVGAKGITGGGTGLGLTIVKSITDEQNGFVKYEKDEVLKGAKFSVWLPKE